MNSVEELPGFNVKKDFLCKLTGDFPDAGGSCVKEEVQVNEDEVEKQLKDACILSEGEWKECADSSDTLCSAKCEFKKRKILILKQKFLLKLL